MFVSQLVTQSVRPLVQPIKQLTFIQTPALLKLYFI